MPRDLRLSKAHRVTMSWFDRQYQGWEDYKKGRGFNVSFVNDKHYRLGWNAAIKGLVLRESALHRVINGR